MKILMVDDEDLIRRALTRTLQHRGHFVTEAENGAIALNKMQQDKYDLIILDLLMPEKNGFDVLQEMEKTAPVIVISAFSGSSTNHFHSEDYPQVIGFIKKPFEHLAVVTEKVEELYAHYSRKV